MTLSEAREIRRSLGEVQPLIQEKIDALQLLFRDFHLNEQSRLGAQSHEVWRFLRELRERIAAVDTAIGETDPESLKLAVDKVQQLQLSVLRLENTFKEMGAGGGSPVSE